MTGASCSSIDVGHLHDSAGPLFYSFSGQQPRLGLVTCALTVWAPVLIFLLLAHVVGITQRAAAATAGTGATACVGVGSAAAPAAAAAAAATAACPGEDHASVRRVRQSLRPTEPAEETHADSHWGEAAHLRGVQQGLLHVLEFEHT